jgi:aubergine-like protein
MGSEDLDVIFNTAVIGITTRPVPYPTKWHISTYRINCANPGVYQYHVDFRPMVDSKNIRFKLLNEHRDVIGNVKAFDGNILYLPIRLPNQVIIYD